MRKLVRNPLVYSLPVGAGITVGSVFVAQPEVKAEESIMADCCQEPDGSCRDRFGWNHADPKKGPACGPIEI